MNKKIQTLVSVCDVTPNTLNRVANIVAILKQNDFRAITLLVTPGCQWNKQQIDRLHQLQSIGIELAAHGWSHIAEPVSGWKNRFQTALFPYQNAEHLCLSEPEIVRLINRSFDWFRIHDFAPPTSYVAPARAMGCIGKEKLNGTEFRYFESLTGIYDSKYRVFKRIPLVGFNADTRLRALGINLSNRANFLAAGKCNQLRLSIHPTDFERKLGLELERSLSKRIKATSYADLKPQQLYA